MSDSEREQAGRPGPYLEVTLKSDQEYATLRAENARLSMVIATLTDDRNELEQATQQAQAERDEARQIVADINNSVIGSQGYFTSPSCVTAVEDLKFLANRRYYKLQQAMAALRSMQRYQFVEVSRQGGHYGEEQWTTTEIRQKPDGTLVLWTDVLAVLAALEGS